MIDSQPALAYHLLQIAQREAIPQVPSDAEHYHVVLKMLPHSRYQNQSQRSATHPSDRFRGRVTASREYLERVGKGFTPCFIAN
jgi:hypothetical protein